MSGYAANADNSVRNGEQIGATRFAATVELLEARLMSLIWLLETWTLFRYVMRPKTLPISQIVEQ